MLLNGSLSRASSTKLKLRHACATAGVHPIQDWRQAREWVIFAEVNQTTPKINPSGFSRWRSAPVLTRGRIWFAFTVAVVTDAIQLLLGPFGWVFVDEALDVIAMILTSAALGFHMLLLPTFVLKLIPGPDMLPTWTACTAAVVMLRKRAQRQAMPPPIDVYAEVSPMPRRERDNSPPPPHEPIGSSSSSSK